MGSSKLELYQFVNELHDYFDIDYDSFPVDTIDLCLSRPGTEIQYHRFKTNGFCAAVLLGDKIDTVVLNSNRAENEVNFDCGHEIIHKTKHRGFGIDTFSCMDLKSKKNAKLSFLEWEANEGSAQLLVPYYSLLPEIKKSYHLLRTWHDFCQFKVDLSNKYGVTDAVINYRFESLKYEIIQYMNGIDLKSLSILSNSQQRAKGIRCQSLNDVEEQLYKSECERFKKIHCRIYNRSCLDVVK